MASELYNTLIYAPTRRLVGGVTSMFSSGSKMVLHWWGVPIAAVGLGALSQWDHAHEKDQIRREYENEIAAKLGKRPEQVTTSDLQVFSAENPVLAEALKRSLWKRNLSIGVTALSLVAAFALTAWVASLLVPATVLFYAATFATSFAAYMITDRALSAAGSRAFGLREPSLTHVARSPALQEKLSVPSQIRYLERLQSRVNPRDPESRIHRSQVLAVFAAADPDLAARIEARFGAKLLELPREKRVEAVTEFGGPYNLDALADDLNHRRVRAQEIAFRAYGQESGVPRLESAKETVLERTNAQLQEKLAVVQEKVGHLSAQVKDHAVALGDKVKSGAQTAAARGQDTLAAVKSKMPFGKAQVSAAVPEEQDPARVAIGMKPQDAGFAARETPPSPSKAGQVAAQKEQAGQMALNPG